MDEIRRTILKTGAAAATVAAAPQVFAQQTGQGTTKFYERGAVRSAGEVLRDVLRRPEAALAGQLGWARVAPPERLRRTLRPRREQAASGGDAAGELEEKQTLAAPLCLHPVADVQDRCYPSVRKVSRALGA